MQFGVCFSDHDTAAVADAGFDYVERAAARVLDVSLGDDAWAAARDAVLASRLPTPVCNLFFPGDVALVGPARDLGRAVEYAEKIFERLQAIGATVQVFGSGQARRVPDGYSGAKALEELEELAARLGPPAERRGVTIAMEHLRASECNLLTSLAETLEFVRRVNHPAVRLLADSFHMAQMGEPWEVIGECGPWLAHVHVADGATRHEPSLAGSDLRPVFRELKAAGYDARVSVECGWQDMPGQLRATHDLLAAQWAEA